MIDSWQALTTYRSPQLVEQLVHAMDTAIRDKIEIMQICGTHTWNYRRHGLAALLPQNLSLVAGPGCPVCVTDQMDIDWAIELARERQHTLVTFGDLMRIPGNNGSLAEMRSQGTDIQVVLSPLKALDIALSQPSRRVILVALGFETTAPAVAATLQSAHGLGLSNFSVALLLKRLIPALGHLFGQAKPDGLLGPGHVAAITGSRVFAFLPQELGLPCAISGFEPVDMLMGLLNLVNQVNTGIAQVSNAYPRVVTAEGNQAAKSLVEASFTPAPAQWRGLGTVPETGYRLVHELRRFAMAPPTTAGRSEVSSQCLCHLVILGKSQPEACIHFAKDCTPQRPLGPCMVSQEGTCAAHFYFPVLDPLPVQASEETR